MARSMDGGEVEAPVDGEAPLYEPALGEVVVRRRVEACRVLGRAEFDEDHCEHDEEDSQPGDGRVELADPEQMARQDLRQEHIP